MRCIGPYDSNQPQKFIKPECGKADYATNTHNRRKTPRESENSEQWNTPRSRAIGPSDARWLGLDDRHLSRHRLDQIHVDGDRLEGHWLRSDWGECHHGRRGSRQLRPRGDQWRRVGAQEPLELVDILSGSERVGTRASKR